ncbi:hypothetical protein CB1_000740051 [Camelus ferus]|nr:hypothetical protein CB1_000740051 [Camelus ferus]
MLKQLRALGLQSGYAFFLCCCGRGLGCAYIHSLGFWENGRGDDHVQALFSLEPASLARTRLALSPCSMELAGSGASCSWLLTWLSLTQDARILAVAAGRFVTKRF